MEYYVYVLTKNKKCVYVGFTNNLAKRLIQHKKDKDFDCHLVVEKFENKKDALLCERSIIKYLTIFPNEKSYNSEYCSLAVIRDFKMN